MQKFSRKKSTWHLDTAFGCYRSAQMPRRPNCGAQLVALKWRRPNVLLRTTVFGNVKGWQVYLAEIFNISCGKRSFTIDYFCLLVKKGARSRVFYLDYMQIICQVNRTQTYLW